MTIKPARSRACPVSVFRAAGLSPRGFSPFDVPRRVLDPAYENGKRSKGRQNALTVLIPLIPLLLASAGQRALAQVVPWDSFSDEPASSSLCDLINAENSELVLLTDTAQLVIVSGNDVILTDTFVDVDNNVFFEQQPVGFLSFAEDGDGFRTLWWLSLTGRVVSVDGFTGEPSETDSFPTDFTDVPCDACPFWDDQNICVDAGDGGGVIVPPVIEPPVSVTLCGSSITVAFVMTLGGMMFMGLVRKRNG